MTNPGVEPFFPNQHGKQPWYPQPWQKKPFYPKDWRDNMHNDVSDIIPTPKGETEPFFKRNFAVLCLDETGSMQGQEHRVVSSLNEYVTGLPEDCHVCVFTFNANQWRKFYDGHRRGMNNMTREDYKPRSGTPLFDAVARTIKHAESISKPGDKVMIMIDTDGYENASREYNHDQIKSLVSRKKEAGWEFMFMANGLDQFSANQVGFVGASLGMNSVSTTYANRMSSYGAASASTTDYFAK